MSRYRPFSIDEIPALCGRYVRRDVFVNGTAYVSMCHLQIVGFANGLIAIGPEYIWPEELLEEYCFADTNERCGIAVDD